MEPFTDMFTENERENLNDPKPLTPHGRKKKRNKQNEHFPILSSHQLLFFHLVVHKVETYESQVTSLPLHFRTKCIGLHTSLLVIRLQCKNKTDQRKRNNPFKKNSQATLMPCMVNEEFLKITIETKRDYY